MTGPGGAASIADHALLSDLQTAALIDRCGTVDWWRVPQFDSAACFAALLDTPAAGGSRLAPAGRPGTRECTAPSTTTPPPPPTPPSLSRRRWSSAPEGAVCRRATRVRDRGRVTTTENR